MAAAETLSEPVDLHKLVIEWRNKLTDAKDSEEEDYYENLLAIYEPMIKESEGRKNTAT